MSSEEKYFMKLALEQAGKALFAKEVPVGCVFVQKVEDSDEMRDISSGDMDSSFNLSARVLSAGFNTTNTCRNGTRHAELVAIDDLVLRQGRDPTVFRGCELYVTCEPCIMCAGALAHLGISQVFFGCHNDRFGGNGSVLNIHEHSSSDYTYNVTAGLMRDEAVDLFRQFYNGENQRAFLVCRIYYLQHQIQNASAKEDPSVQHRSTSFSNSSQ